MEQFHDDGSTIDITEWVDSQNYEVKSPDYYSPIIFKYADPSTYLAEEYNNKSEGRRQYGYGSLSYEVNNDRANRLPYKEYKVELPFEQVVLNPIQDDQQPDETDLDIVYGWIVSESQSPTQTKPMATLH